MDARVAGLILAAGRSERYGAIKALSRWDGRSAIECAHAALAAGGCSPIWSVLAPPHAEAIVAQLPGGGAICCPAPTGNMLTSLRYGLGTLLATRAEAIVVSLVDHPAVQAETVARLIQAWQSERPELVTPRYQGRSGHPYLLARALAERLLAAPEGATARDVFRQVARRRYLRVDDAAVLQDIDAPEQ